MKTIKENVKNEIVINKSRFITYLFNVSNIDEISKSIDLVKSLNKDATHYVTAYILESDSRSNDNSEPKGTAGLPSLEVLRKENLVNVLLVTVRYFGGIKLGASGLTRAYSNSASEALKIANFIERKKVQYFDISCSYKDYQLLENKNYIININTSFDDLVTLKGKVLLVDIDKLKEVVNFFKDKYQFNLRDIKEEFLWRK